MAARQPLPSRVGDYTRGMKLRIEPPEWATELISDLTDMDRDPLPLAGRQGEVFEYELPDDVYFEYAFRHPDGRIVGDPANDRGVVSPWYPGASSVTGPAYRPDELAEPDAPRAEGDTARLRLQSDLLPGQTRRVSVYTPAGHDGDELPLVLVQDGVAFSRLGRIQHVADALLARGEVRPARFAFIEPVDRTQEYGFSDAYFRFVTEELLPILETDFPATGERVWLGASLGGLFSATVAMERPELVDALVSFSGAFLGSPQEREFYRTEESWLLERLQAGVEPPPSWYMEVGTLEWLKDVHERLAAELARRGARHELVLRHAGHNWTSWRNGQAQALRYVLGV